MLKSSDLDPASEIQFPAPAAAGSSRKGACRPTAIIPPRPPTYGEDPHETPRRDPHAQLQTSLFMQTGGAVVETCGGAPCSPNTQVQSSMSSAQFVSILY